MAIRPELVESSRSGATGSTADILPPAIRIAVGPSGG
jgi:hypothetical protein